MPEDKEIIENETKLNVKLKIISFKDKENWNLIRKHGIGNNKKA